jgi:hypothetical protein
MDPSPNQREKPDLYPRESDADPATHIYCHLMPHNSHAQILSKINAAGNFS